MKFNVLVLPGDGIGVEVTCQAVRVLEHVARKFGHDLKLSEGLLGGIAIHKTGTPFPEETARLALEADATLMGAVGLPEFDNAPPDQRPEAGLLGIRKTLGVYANLRPVRAYQALLDSSPLKNERVAGVDMIIVRELTGGLYYGTPRGISGAGAEERGVNTMTYTRAEIERVARMAFTLARGRRKKVTSVDKSNVLETSQLWRKVVIEVASEFPDVELEHMLVDNCAMQLVLNPRPLRRSPDGKHVRRHPERRRRGAGRLDRHAALGVDRRSQTLRRVDRPLRAGARLGAGHRGAEQGQSVGRHRLGSGHARIQLRPEGGSGRRQRRHGAVLNSGRVTADLKPKGTPATTSEVGDAIIEIL